MSLKKQQSVDSLGSFDFQSLIIDNPEKQANWKRVCSFLVTLFLWGGWFYLLTPFPDLLNRLFITGFSDASIQNMSYIVVFFALLFGVASWQIVWLNYNRIRFRNQKRRSSELALANHEIGSFFTVDKNKLGSWQQSKCLIVMHDQTGEIVEVDVNEFFSFAPSLPKVDLKNQVFQRHYIVLLPRKSSRQLYTQINNDFAIIMKVLSTIFNITFVNCRVSKKHLLLTIEIPENYKVENVVKEIKAASASIIEKKYANETELKSRNLVFWRSKQLITTTKLDGNAIRKFIEEMTQPKNDSEFLSNNLSKGINEFTEKQEEDVKLIAEFWQDNNQSRTENKVINERCQIDKNDFLVCAPEFLAKRRVIAEMDYSRVYLIILPLKHQSALFIEIGSCFKVFMKILCTIHNARLIDCIVFSNYLSLTLDIPNEYNPYEFIQQLNKASTLIIEKKYVTEANNAEDFNFWCDNMLITTPDLVDVVFKEFINGSEFV